VPVHPTEPLLLLFLCFGLPLYMAVKTYVNIYIYICMYFFLEVGEDVCHYTFEPRSPNSRELGS
jgi:hypothetical protein